MITYKQMKKTLFIHIGWHKTATSLIQLYLDEHRERLKEFDVCYPVIDDRPNPGLIKHSYLYLSIINKLKMSHLQEDLKVCDFDELFELSVKEITDSGCRYAIISEEGLSQATRGIPKLMGRYRDYFDDIKIVAYVRRQDYFFESLYGQFVKQKPDRSKLYLHDYRQLDRVRKRADYELILDWWAEEFGKENILVAPFEPRTIVPDPVAYFFKLAGLPLSIVDNLPLELKEAHISPPREVTEYFRHMNLNNNGYFVDVLAEYLMKSGAVTTNTKYFGRSDREKILQEYDSSNKAVARKYLHKDDGVLFEESIIDFPNCPETWEGLKPLDLLDYALPISGKMAVEIAVLRYENSNLKTNYSKLKNENLELRNENRRLANIKKTIYHFLQRRFRIILNKFARDQG